ncbi:MAG: hypothetical protein EZS28_035813, partial [Streblomastix strix]
MKIINLSVVDPKNSNLPGFKFVEIKNDKIKLEDSIQKIAIAVPEFYVQDGEKQINFSIRHTTQRWKHGAVPRKYMSEKDDQKDNIEMVIYIIDTMSCTGVLRNQNYIQYEQRNTLSLSFFAALEEIIPNVPDTAILGAINLIQSLRNDELIQLALNYSTKKVAQYALDSLIQRGYSLGNLASKFIDLNIRQNDPRSNAVIAMLSQFKVKLQNREIQSKSKEETRFNQFSFVVGQQQGFLCDREDILKENVTPDKLLSEVAKCLQNIVEQKQSPEFAEELLNNGLIKDKMPRYITTPNAIARLDPVVYALKSGIPLLIQGPTSASKSLTAQVAALGLYGQLPLVYALGEQTEVGDLIGRKMLIRKGTSMLSYVPGVLTIAYKTGRVLILDEFDLCPLNVLSSILSILDGNTIEIDGQQTQRHSKFRIIATLNGETEGFTSQQRNILPKEILARFCTISFPAMSPEECKEIFSQLIQQQIPDLKDASIPIADVHQSVEKYYASNQQTDKSRGKAELTLRNFSYALDLMVLDKLKPRDACQVAYIAQIPVADRKNHNIYMDALGKSNDNFQKLRDEITKTAIEMHIHPHPQFIDAAVYAIVAARNGLHVLLEGPSGCGLTTLARFVAKFCMNKTETQIQDKIPCVLLGSESTVENILGSFKPQEMNNDETDLTKLIKWEDGPLEAHE